MNRLIGVMAVLFASLAFVSFIAMIVIGVVAGVRDDVTADPAGWMIFCTIFSAILAGSLVSIYEQM